jgi:UDP-N-acetylmuramoylalanine--D-glutamate ligase
VRKAAALAAPGSVVLLSPAFTSYDMFRDYEDRGRRFKATVLEELQR